MMKMKNKKQEQNQVRKETDDGMEESNLQSCSYTLPDLDDKLFSNTRSNFHCRRLNCISLIFPDWRCDHSLYTWVIFCQAFITLNAFLYIFNIVLHALFCFKVFCPKLAKLFQQSQADVKQSKIIASLILQWMFLVSYLRTTFANSAGQQQHWFSSWLLSTRILSCSWRCSHLYLIL